jgi:hypothetical protein
MTLPWGWAFIINGVLTMVCGLLVWGFLVGLLAPV